MRAKIVWASVYDKETQFLMYKPKIVWAYKYTNEYVINRNNESIHTSVYGKETEVRWRRLPALSNKRENKCN